MLMLRVTPVLCWSCHSLVLPPQPYCSECDAIQQPAPLSPFAQLGLPIDVFIEKQTLTDAYIKAIALVHPDRAAQRSKKEQLFALEHSTAINAAYRTLSDTYQRALCCYTLAGGKPFPETSTDQELLLYALEQREALQEADNPEKIRALMDDVQKKTARALEKIASALRDNDLEHAAKALLWLRYGEKFQADAHRRLTTGQHQQSVIDSLFI